MKKSVKLISVLASVLVAGSILSGCASKSGNDKGTSAAGGGTIKIGAVLPLTGDVATFGQSSKNALELLKEQVNAKGGVLGKQIEFLYEDDENKPANSPTVAQKLIDEGVVGLIGSVSSKCSIAMGPIATQNKIPMITSSSTNPDVTTKGGDYVFRACFIDPFQGTVLAKFASQDLKKTTAAVLYDQANDYSKGLAEFFVKGFEGSGGKIVAKETYTGGDKDFKAQLTKIKTSNPDVILLPDYYNTVGLITKQAQDLGIKAIFLGGDGWDSDDLTKVAGTSINGGYFSNHYSAEDTSQAVVDFRKAYGDKYKGAVPDALAALAYDAGKILIKGIENAKSTDGDKVKEALKATNDTFVSGKVTYDKDRNPVKGAVIIQVVDGKYKFTKQVNP